MWLTPPATQRLELQSPLSPEECIQRLSAAIEPERWLGPLGIRPVVGRICGESIRLRKRLLGRSSFQLLLTATMKPWGGGTAIRGEIAEHPFTRAFVPIWFGILTLMSVFLYGWVLVSTFTDLVPAGHGDWQVFLGPPIGFFMGYSVVRSGRSSARGEAQFLTDFMRETLDAK